MNQHSLNPGEPIDNLAIGTLVEVDGTHIVAELDANVADLSRVFGGVIYPIGQFGSIVRVHFGRRLIYGYVSRLRMKSEYEREKGLSPGESGSSARVIEADLFGEGEWLFDTNATPPTWRLSFERGVSTFPLPLQKVYLTPRTELHFIYGQATDASIVIGEHVGSSGTPAYANINELLGKHTAILGSTGSGKSGATAAIVHCLLERGDKQGYGNWHPQIIFLDPHNEYGAAFPGHRRLSTDEGNFSLPYWLLSLQETLALVIGKTEFVATSQSNIVKSALLTARQNGAKELGIDPTAITVDSPVPYALSSFVSAVLAGRPDQVSKQDSHNSILQKLDILKNDARLKFMMDEWDGASDPFSTIVNQFMGDGDPIRIVDLSGVPNEVAGAASSAVARTLFSVKLWQTPQERRMNPVLLVCEEAHRYVPNRGEAQYEAAQEAIRRLAKEGRKYGIGLMLVSQRPSEVEATVLSQCNSWIVLRITNDADREHVKAILPDSLAGLTKVLSGLRRREAIFVGQATPLPSRILIRRLDEDKLPDSRDIEFDSGWQSEPIGIDALGEIAKRWRLQCRVPSDRPAKADTPPAPF
jgi:DNA helicase HerA-like ATPase